MTRLRTIRQKRRASIAVEMAFTAPVFFVLIFASVEFSRVHMIQNAIENAAFEGARRGIVPGATAESCRTTTQQLLDFAGIKSSTITVTPSVITANDDHISVEIQVPLDGDNGFGIAGFFKGRTLSKTIEMPRETMN